jgi:hypothetical protein
MTVPNNKIKESFSGDGTTILFPFTGISFYQVADLDVLIADADGVETVLTQNTDYTITNCGAGMPYAYGDITMIGAYAIAPPASGETIVVYRDVPYTQEIDLAAGGAMPAATLEEGYDRGVMMLQQLYDLVGRTVTLPISSSLSGLTLPTPEADYFLRWNALADNLENFNIADLSLYSVSAFAETLLDDANAAAVLATLGLDADLATLSLPASTTISAYGKTLIDDADAAAARATLAIVPADDSAFVTNITLAATVAAKALTVALKTKAGTDPSAADKVQIAFRSATITSGAYVVRDVTAALSVVLSSGSTLGFTAALAGRIYIWALDNAGTVELALSRTADIFQESNLVSTTAEGGAGAADSATVMYSTTARSNLACRCLGYIDITTGGTAGEWDNAPTKIQIMGPGVKRTGEIVQVQHAGIGTLVSGSTAMPNDDTIPQITEGTEILTCAIIPTSAVNQLLIIASLALGYYTTVNTGAMALFQDATAGAIAAKAIAPTGGGGALVHKKVAGTASSTTFKLRAGTSAADAYYCNTITSNSTRFGGGTMEQTTLTIQEISA